MACKIKSRFFTLGNNQNELNVGGILDFIQPAQTPPVKITALN